MYLSNLLTNLFDHCNHIVLKKSLVNFDSETVKGGEQQYDAGAQYQHLFGFWRAVGSVSELSGFNFAKRLLLLETQDCSRGKTG